MELEHHPIYREINKILSSKTPIKHNHYELMFHLMGLEGKNKTIKTTKVLSIDIERDYLGSFGDVIIVRFALPMGTFTDHLFPLKDQLEATLISRPLKSTTKGDFQSDRYKAVLLQTENLRLKTSDTRGSSTHMLNLTNILELEVQLMPLSNYILRTTQCQTIFNQTKPEDALKTMVTDLSQKIPDFDKNGIKGVCMVDADNKEVIEQMAVPVGSHLFDLPKIMQNQMVGVYKNGMASYIQDGIWHIFPPWDFNREHKGKQMTLILLPDKKFPGIKKTYMVNSNHIVILITGDTSYSNTQKQDKLSHGTSLFYVNAESLYDKNTFIHKDNRAIVKRNELTAGVSNSEYDNKDYIKMSNEGITSNWCKQESKINKLKGGQLACVWENSQADLIKPGQIVNLMTMGEKGRTLQGKGIIVGAHHHTKLARPGLTESNYITNTALHIRFDDKNFHLET